MSIRHEIVDVCDRCNIEHRRETHKQAGVEVSWTGDLDATSHAAKAWLCATCARAFFEFIEPSKKRKT